MSDSEGKPIDMPDTFAEAERFQRLFVKPMVDAVRAEVATHLGPIADAHDTIKAEQAAQSARLTALEGSQRKALVGYGVFSSGLAIALAYAWDWIKKGFLK